MESPLPIQSRFLSGVFLLNCREKCAFRSFQIHPGTGSTGLTVCTGFLAVCGNAFDKPSAIVVP